VLVSVTICPNCGADLVSPPEPGSAELEEELTFAFDLPGLEPEPEPPFAFGPAAEARARLVLKRAGAPTAETFLLGERAVVGRFDPDTGPVDVDLGSFPEAVYVSRRHAELYHDASGQWFVRDLNSSNGTFIRSGGEGSFRRITEEQTLQDGDEVAFGNAQFVFRVG
jgi:hypothetical protein